MPAPELRQIATLTFTNQEDGGEGVAIVKAATGQVALTLSLIAGSDTEAFFTLAAAEQLAGAISDALIVARSG